MPLRRKDENGEEVLTPKEERFVEHYIANGGNGTQAAINAGYSPDSAYAIASENLRKLEIARRIRQRIKEATTLTSNEIIGTLASQMRADITDFLGDRGDVDVGRIKQQGLGHLVKKFKVRRTYEGSGEDKIPIDVLEVELYDAQAAASKLAKITAIDNHPRRVEIDVAELMREKLTLAVQNGLNTGWSLRETLGYLAMRGVPKKHLALVRGEDLVIPVRAESTSDGYHNDDADVAFGRSNGDDTR